MSDELHEDLRGIAGQARPGEDWPGRIARARRHRRQRWSLTAAATAAVIAVPLIALAGTGSTTKSNLSAGPTGPTTSPSPLSSSVPMDVACPVQEPVHLADDQPPVTDAFICGEDDQRVPGDGIWLVRYVHRITGGLEGLLAAYQAADTPPPTGEQFGCPTVLYAPSTVYLHSDEGTVAVRAPRGVCSDPQATASEAFRALTTETVWTQRDRRVQSEESVTTGCTDAYKDTLSMDAGSPSRTPSATPLEGPVLVCTYKVEADAQGDRIGRLDGHRALTADEIAAVNAALRNVTVDPTCNRSTQTRFALLVAKNGPTVVALDGGCAVSQNDGGWFRAGDDLRAALA
ncbi:MAG: hypothetical protein QOG99_3828 [Frankiales bacterium]|jgi:hypothetical protein|nr:hypothetical protein [Frankiales bacterium]